MNVQSNICDKREVILYSALELITERGLHDTPISLIARQANVAAGTIYHYFAGKDELITEIFRHINALLQDVILVYEKDRDYKEQYFELGHSLYRFFQQNPVFVSFFDQYRSSPYFKNTIEEYVNCKSKFLLFFEKGMEQGILRQMDKHLFGLLVWGSVTNVIRTSIAIKKRFEDSEINQLLQVLWDGLKANEN